jgi:hypothetical protein
LDTPEAFAHAATLANEWVMRLHVTCGPDQPLGDTPDGRRTNYDILGGTMSGPAISGVVLPGGADWFLERPDGVGQLDARYSLRTADGVIINVWNRGLLRYADGLREQDLGPWPPARHLYACHCTPQFTAPRGRHGWLNTALFVGEVSYPDADGVVVDFYRLI